MTTTLQLFVLNVLGVQTAKPTSNGKHNYAIIKITNNSYENNKKNNNIHENNNSKTAIQPNYGSKHNGNA
jgi:hypothetical protein